MKEGRHTGSAREHGSVHSVGRSQGVELITLAPPEISGRDEARFGGTNISLRFESGVFHFEVARNHT